MEDKPGADQDGAVALCEEGVDRNQYYYADRKGKMVALCEEGVDRNRIMKNQF